MPGFAAGDWNLLMPAGHVQLLAGRYELVEELGRGGIGVVHRARDERLGRDVAVKLLHPWIAQEEDSVARFRREALTLAQLSHSHIVRLYDFDDEGEQAFLVLELVHGEGLDAKLAGRLFEQEEAARLMLPVASALAYAHGRGIVHRDLKPANILVEPDGRVVVSDFGLARLAQGTQSITATGVLVGSPEYWAPEQASGSPVTQASDMYALGCILFQLLTGRLPFEGEDRLAAGYRRVHEDAPSIRSVRAGLSPEVTEAVDALLARAPERRPTAPELVQRLARIAAPVVPPADRAGRDERPTITTLRPVPPTLHRPRSRLRRATGVPALLAALVLAAAGVAAALLVRGGGESASRSPQRTRVVTEVSSRVETVVVTTTAAGAPAEPTTTTASTPSAPGPAAAAWETFQGNYFSVAHPVGWRVETAEASKGGYLDTTIRNPQSPAELVRVDLTPSSHTEPLANARQIEGGLTGQSGYRRLALERRSLNGYDAAWWEFTVSERGTLLHKVDLFLTDDSGNSFAILTQAPEETWGERRQLFDHVRGSFAPMG